jgi:glutamyl-tRNA synthetase
MPDGRFAPSPTGDLHLGNLRTALLAWLFARSSDSNFLVRMEDLDLVTASPDHERSQLRDLAAIGIDHDGEVIRQSERFDFYGAVIDDLERVGLTYPCFCTRREIREAASAPHGEAPDGAYPGTCRDLTDHERAERLAEGRPPALRLRTGGEVVEFVDLVCGPTRGRVDDFVLRRNDGVPAYNLAVVVDDAAQRVEQVVRADDLLTSTPRQIHLARQLGLAVPSYAHVPLVVAPDGSRLAKRHGAVTLTDLAERGMDADAVRSRLAVTLGLADPGERVGMADLVGRFDLRHIPRAPWTYQEDEWLSTQP